MHDNLCPTCQQYLAEAARDAGSEPRLVVLDCRTLGIVAPLQLDGQGGFEGNTYSASSRDEALHMIQEIRDQLPVGERFIVLAGCAGAH